MGNLFLYTATDLLARFQSVSLTEIECVKLMDRKDTKYVLSFENLAPVLSSLIDYYYVLTINNLRVFSYRTDYYDTSNLDMFNDHHNGKLNRFKVRQREYVESNLSFLEVKFRSNKGRVIKERIERNSNDEKAFKGFISAHTPYDPGDLNLKLINRFNRFTLVDKNMQERVTFDFNLSFSDNSRDLALNGLIILEVKQDKGDKQSRIFDVLKNHALRPTSVSKYCVGISLLNEQSKFNNFKKTILMINKISHVELSA